MALGALVEAVDLELEPVEAELEDQEALEEARGLVGDPAPAEPRVDREPAETRDPASFVRSLPGAHARRLTVDFDQHHAARAGLFLEALEIGEDVCAVVAPGRRQPGAYVAVGVELDDEVEVGARRAADRHAHVRTGSAARRGRRSVPEASATPARISAPPSSMVAVIASSRISAP